MDQNQKNKMRFLLIYSFIRFIAQRVSCVLTPGVVLVADGKNDAKQLALNLVKTGIAKKCIEDATDEELPDNYQMSVKVLEKNHSENKILCFLETEEFLPVVIAAGICPNYIEEDVYVLRMDPYISETSINEFHEISLWILNHLELVSHEVKRICRNQKIVEIAKKIFPLYTVVAIIAGILETFYIDTFGDELLANSETKEFLKWGKQMLEDIAKLTSFCKISEAVAYAVYDYINNGNKCYFVDLSSGKEVVTSAMFQTVIFYDDTWYYLQENYLKEMCSQICKDVSFRQVKEELVKEGVLEVNEWSHDNYTIQMSVHIDGKTKRKHFLKVMKDIFLSEDDEYLEDIINRHEASKEDKNDETGCNE